MSLTLATAKTQYLDNSSYDINGSPSECASFIEACRALLLLMPKSSKLGRVGGEADYNPELVEKQLAEAKRWHQAYRANTSGGGPVGLLGLERFRD